MFEKVKTILLSALVYGYAITFITTALWIIYIALGSSELALGPRSALVSYANALEDRKSVKRQNEKLNAMWGDGTAETEK